MDDRSAIAQRWSAEQYALHAGFVPALGAPVLELLAPQPGERILDLGCGDGALTRRIAAAGAAVIAVDASADMIAAARSSGLDARVVDAQALPFANEFDAVFSNAALHWMPQQADVIAGVRRALRPGGRFVAEMGGHGNCAAIRTALAAVLERHGIDANRRSPWFFPTAERYRALLEAGGFRVATIELFPRLTPLPTGLRGWFATFAEPFFAGLDAAERDALAAEVEALLRPALCDDRGNWTADYVRLRFIADARS